MEGESERGHVYNQDHNRGRNARAHEEGNDIERGLGHFCDIIYKGEWYMAITIIEWVDVNCAKRYDY